jgi:hypothetical protein
VRALPADISCRSFVELHRLNSTFIDYERQQTTTSIDEYNPVLLLGHHQLVCLFQRFIAFIRRLYEQCDNHLLHHAASIVKCCDWQVLTPAMQQRIRDSKQHY